MSDLSEKSPLFKTLSIFQNDSCHLTTKVVKLLELARIEILCLIGFGGRMCTQNEVVELFNEIHPDRPPITQTTLSKIEWQCMK